VHFLASADSYPVLTALTSRPGHHARRCLSVTHECKNCKHFRPWYANSYRIFLNLDLMTILAR